MTKRREMRKWTKRERVNRVEGVVDIPPSVIRLLKYRKVHASCCEKFAQENLNRLSRLENQPKNVPKHQNQNAQETHTITDLRDEIQIMTRAGLMIKPSALPSG